MSWTSEVTILNAGNVTDTESYSDAVELRSDETAHVQVRAGFGGGSTDSMEIRVYASTDGTNWDDVTFATAQTIENTQTTLSLTVTGVYQFRIGLLRVGTTDTITATVVYTTNGDYHDCSLDI